MLWCVDPAEETLASPAAGAAALTTEEGGGPVSGEQELLLACGEDLAASTASWGEVRGWTYTDMRGFGAGV